MNKFELQQFHGLLKKEVLEHKALFIWTPVILGLLIFVIDFLIVTSLNTSLDDETMEAVLTRLAAFFGGAPTEAAPVLVFPTLPFLLIFYICALLYLAGALCHDRRDLSILFWQSMPVSNLKTVLAKLTAIIVIAPVFYVAVIFVLYLAAILWLTIAGQGIGQGVEVNSFGLMLLTVVLSLPIIYLFVVSSALWLLPLAGWLLLFSAFARRAPLLWAMGVLGLIVFLEGFLFGSDFLSNWIGSRSDIDNFLIVEYNGLFDRLFSYDMLMALLVGAVLISGAVYMRRFTD